MAGRPQAVVTDEPSLKRFLDELEMEHEARSTRVAELMFEQYRSKRRPDELTEAEEAQSELLLDPAYHEAVSRYVGKVSDPLLGRRAEVWNRTFQGARVSAHAEVRRLVNEISDRIVSYRYRVMGEELDLGATRHVLRTERNRERRQAALLSFAPLSRDLSGVTRELFQLRNELARKEGYPTYAQMQMAAQGVTLEWSRETLKELAAATESVYRQVLEGAADRAGLAEVEPWDIKFLLDGEGGLPARYFPRSGIIDRLKEWAEAHGVDLERLGISVHFLDIPYNGLCMPIRRGDVRILGNPADGHNYYKTAFHELGHALHAAYSDPGSYILRREPSLFNEGMAEMLGYLVNDRDWLAQVGLSEAEIAGAEREMLGPTFAYLRQRTAHALFEYAAYENPGADLDRLNAEVEGEVLGCTVNPSPRWAAEPNAWFSRYPVYWQNYVLADVIASQIHHDLRRRFGRLWGSREAVEFMRQQYWKPGAAVEWQVKVEQGTGRPLGAAALVADLTGANR